MAKRSDLNPSTDNRNDVPLTALEYPFQYLTPFWIDWGKRTIDDIYVWNNDETTVFYVSKLSRGNAPIIITFFDEDGNRINEMSGEVTISKGMSEFRVNDFIRVYENNVRKTGYLTIVSKIPLYISGTIFKTNYGTNIPTEQDSRTINFYPIV